MLLDALACEQAGMRTDTYRRLQAVTERVGDLGAGTRVWLSGAAIHALEFDDAHKRSKTHPAAVVIPAVREAARIAGASGPQTITAIVAGYEAMLRVGIAVGASAHRRAGWHATCTTGAIGAAVGAAHALRLDASLTAEAIGHAVSMLGGNFAFYEEGASSKPVQVGNAARVGFFAANMAAGGLRGSRSALETRDGGFFSLFGGDPQRVLDDLDAFIIPEVAFKPYPCCRTVQAGIDAAFDLHANYRGGPIHVRTFAIAIEQNGFYANGNVARSPFSLPYVIAAALIDGRVDLQTFTPDRIAALGDAERAVTWSVDPQLEARYPVDWPAEVQIEGASPVRVDVASGDPRHPMSPDRWEMKLETCAGSAEAARKLRAQVET
ncbi:MAG: MmgE/PrpD family protein, partial [Vulcanimicrobiaceae bacterium]